MEGEEGRVYIEMLIHNLVDLVGCRRRRDLLPLEIDSRVIVWDTLCFESLAELVERCLPWRWRWSRRIALLRRREFRNAECLGDLVLIAALLVEEGGFLGRVSIRAAGLTNNIGEEYRRDLCVKPREEHPLWVLLPGV